MLAILKTAYREFGEDDCPRMAAAMSYYAVFSLPALLLMVLVLASWFVDPVVVERRLGTDLARWLGPSAARQALNAFRATLPSGGSAAPWAAWASAVALLFGASGVLSQLQTTLNRIWEVAPASGGGVRGFLSKRLLSLAMVAGLAFLVLLSVGLSTAVAAMGERWDASAIASLAAPAVRMANLGVTWLLVSVFFAAVFRVLPDAEIGWKDVWVGAAGTGTLFVVGQAAINIVLGRTDPGAAFGAAGALAVILAWVHYSSMILFFGAEFTEAWAKSRGRVISPSPGAVRVTRSTITVDAVGAEEGA